MEVARIGTTLHTIKKNRKCSKGEHDSLALPCRKVTIVGSARAESHRVTMVKMTVDSNMHEQMAILTNMLR